MKKLTLFVLVLALSSTQNFAANRPAKKLNRTPKPSTVRTTKGASNALSADIYTDNTPTPAYKKINLLPSNVRNANEKNLLLKPAGTSSGVTFSDSKNTAPAVVPFLGRDGKPVLGKDGKAIMVAAGKDGKPLLDKIGRPTIVSAAMLAPTPAPAPTIPQNNTNTSAILTMPSTLASLGSKLLSTLSFCGEKIPLDNQEVINKLDQTFQRYMGLRGALSHYARLGGRYKNEFVKVLQKQGVPAELYYLSIAESGLANRTSSQGAAGFWQFMPESAPLYGLEVSETVDERWHPQKAATAAATYLKWLHRKFGNWALAAGAYNMGEGAMANALATQGRKSYFQLQLNPETGQYVYNILTIKYMMDNPSMFGIATSGKYAPIPYQREMVDYDIADLAEFAQNCDTDYESLKILNPWLISDHLKVQPGKRYEIRLPMGGNTQKIVADELIPVPFSLTKTVRELRDSIVQYFATKGGKYETMEDSTEGDFGLN